MHAARAIRIAHLSDLHLRDASDVAALDHQLRLIASRSPDHLAITGDLLDRWDPRLLRNALAALRANGFDDPDKITIIHGNHDLASSGGHPRGRGDLWRLALRSWDPPALLRRRRRAFYGEVAGWIPGAGQPPPFQKQTASGLRIAALDSIPTPWRPITIAGREITVRHALGCIRRRELSVLAAAEDECALIVLVHHYPLAVGAFSWRPTGRLARVVRQVNVPMEIAPADRREFWRAAAEAGIRMVLCGHVHRARLEWHGTIAVGLNGQSGAAWAARTVAFYEIDGERVTMSLVDGC